jgi:hypothetical protein
LKIFFKNKNKNKNKKRRREREKERKMKENFIVKLKIKKKRFGKIIRCFCSDFFFACCFLFKVDL